VVSGLFAVRLPDGISAGIRRLRLGLQHNRLARHVHGRRPAALLVLYIRKHVPEIPANANVRTRKHVKLLSKHWPSIYGILLEWRLNFFSHGSRNLSRS